MKTKVLITGSGGFLMSNYVRRLVYLSNKFPDKYNYVVSSLDSVRSGSLSAIYTNKSHSFHIADLTDKHILDVIFKYERPDVVIHGAHVKNEPLDVLISNNVIGTENLFDCCKKYDVTKTVVLSHYDHLLYDHNERLVNNSRKEILYKFNRFYNTDKWAPKNKFVNINLPNVFGPRQDTGSVVPQAIYHATNNLYYSYPNYKEEYVHVFDVCSAINSVLDYELNLESSSHVHYDVMHGKEIHNSNLIKKIYKLLSRKDGVVFDYSDNEDCREYTNQKIGYGLDLKHIGWQPEFTNDFDKSLQDTVDWYVKNQWFFNNLKDDNDED